MDYPHEEPIQGMFSDPGCRVPGNDGKIGYKKGSAIDSGEFEKIRREYHELLEGINLLD